MIRPLRRRHRLMVCTLGVFLPVAFVEGIAARRPVPVATFIPPGLVAKTSGSGRVLWNNANLWPGHRIVTSLRGDARGSPAVELMFQDLVRPDVLVYWAPGDRATGERLPDDAQLLGALSSRVPLPFPEKQRGAAGRLVLYSLADHEIVATSRPFSVQTN